MMIDMLVHQSSPLVAAQFAEEGMGLAAGGGRAALHEAVDERGQARALGGEIALVGDDERGLTFFSW